MRVRELLRKGDVQVVWGLDRLGRTIKHPIERMADLDRQVIGFQSLQESIDTITPGGGYFQRNPVLRLIPEGNGRKKFATAPRNQE